MVISRIPIWDVICDQSRWEPASSRDFFNCVPVVNVYWGRKVLIDLIRSAICFVSLNHSFRSVLLERISMTRRAAWMGGLEIIALLIIFNWLNTLVFSSLDSTINFVANRRKNCNEQQTPLLSLRKVPTHINSNSLWKSTIFFANDTARSNVIPCSTKCRIANASLS